MRKLIVALATLVAFAVSAPAALATETGVPGTNWTLTASTPYYISPAGYPWGTWQSQSGGIGGTAYVQVEVCRSVLINGGWHEDLCRYNPFGGSSYTFHITAETGGYPMQSCEWTATWAGIKVLWTGGWKSAAVRSAGVRFC